MPSRRNILLTSLGALAAAAGLRATSDAAESRQGLRGHQDRRRSGRSILTPEQFNVLRKHGTERAFTSPLDKFYDPGTYHCAGCDLPLFARRPNTTARTGWPSFWQPLDNAVGMSTDRTWVMMRTEIHCRRCGGHLGHVFTDGPKPTGQRYCMNGVA